MAQTKGRFEAHDFIQPLNNYNYGTDKRTFRGA